MPKGHGQARSARRTRFVMKESDKEYLRKFLVYNFTRMGATEEQAKRAIDSRTPSMLKWIVAWIGHNTKFQETGWTAEILKRAMYAWIHYKATVETIGGDNDAGGTKS